VFKYPYAHVVREQMKRVALIKDIVNFLRTEKEATSSEVYAHLSSRHKLSKRYAQKLLKELVEEEVIEKGEKKDVYVTYGFSKSIHHFESEGDRRAYMKHVNTILCLTKDRNEMPIVYVEVLEEELTWLFGRKYELNEAQRWYQSIIRANLDIEGIDRIDRFPRPEAIRDMFLSHIRTGYNSFIWQASQSLKEKYGDKFPLKEMLGAYESEASQVHEAFNALEPRKDILGVPVERLFGDGRTYARPPDVPLPGKILSRPEFDLTDAKPKPLTPTELLVKIIKIPEYEARQTEELFRNILQELLQIYLKHWFNIPMGGTCQTCEGLIND
jgi:predicted transcriptional regulator